MKSRDVALALVLVTLTSAGRAEAGEQLVEAVSAQDRAAVQSLLRSGDVDVNRPAPDGTTALHLAVRVGDAELVSLLLAARADVTATNRYGITPLLLAATNGDRTVIERLLRAGADPNGATPEGETPLMRAARTGIVGAAEALLAAGAEVGAAEKWLGETALMWAAAEDHPEMTRLLVAHGAQVNARSAVLEFPEVEFDAALMWRAALPRGGLTPLMLAARQGAHHSARALIDAGADLDVRDPDGATALIIAIINAHYDVAALLIEEGAGTNLADAAGMTPLYAAVDMHTQEPRFNRPRPIPSGRSSSVDLITLLLDRGADPNARLTAPLLPRQQDLGDRFLGAGATPLMRAAKPSDFALMRLLLDRGADPSLTLANGTTLLMIAAARRAPNVHSDEDTIRALQLALTRGVDIDAATDTGETALHMAVGRSDAVVQFLAERGANLDLKDKFGRTPLDVALGVPTKQKAASPVDRWPVYESTAALLRAFKARDAAPVNRQ